MMAFGHMRHKRIVFVGDTCIHNHTQPHLQQNMHIIHTPCWQLRSFMCVKVWLLGYKSTCPKQNYYLVKSFKLPCKTLPWGKIIHFGHKFPRISWKDWGENSAPCISDRKWKIWQFFINRQRSSHDTGQYHSDITVTHWDLSLDVPLSAEGKICKHIWQC